MSTRRSFLIASGAATLAAGSASAQDRLPPVSVHRSEITTSRQLLKARPELPVPDDAGLLFYVQHSINRNQIVYAARQAADGNLDPSEPVEVFWRRFDEDGRRRALSFFERIFAFGVNTEARPDKRYSVRIRAHRQREFLVERDDQGKPRALLGVGNRTVRVVYLYAQADDVGFIPRINYVDVYGYDLASGEAIRERARVDM